MNLIKSQNSFEKESSIEKERERRSLSRSKEVHQEEKPARAKDDNHRNSTKDDVNFMMQVKLWNINLRVEFIIYQIFSSHQLGPGNSETLIYWVKKRKKTSQNKIQFIIIGLRGLFR